MLIIISPAKRLDIKFFNKFKHTEPEFLDRSASIVNQLRQFSPDDLAVMMNVSNDLARLTFERYSQWKAPFDTESAAQAIIAFKGDVYRSMNPLSFSEEDMTFAQDHLRILSGLYGFLRPLDLIRAYRLEMGSTLSLADGKSLYEFWSPVITDAINSDIKKHKEKVLVNLASQEYFKAIDTKTLACRVITPVFKEYRNGKYKVTGIPAKLARGMMSRFVIQNRLKKAEEMKLFTMEGYKYDDNLSTENDWVFTR